MRAVEPTGKAQSQQREIDGGIKFTTFIPVRFVRHKARKVIVEPRPSGQLSSPFHPGRLAEVDETLMRALARSFYWQTLLDEGRVDSIAALASAEQEDKVRIQKILKLARLAPDIVDDIARGRAPVGLSQEFFVRNPLPDDWDLQRQTIAALVR